MDKILYEHTHVKVHQSVHLNLCLLLYVPQYKTIEFNQNR